MCMPTDMVIYTFLVRSKRVVRQRRLEHCLSCTSANESEPDGVVLNKVCDKNGQRAPVGDGENYARVGRWLHQWLRNRAAKERTTATRQTHNL